MSEEKYQAIPVSSVEWPYPIEYDRIEKIETDVVVLGGGIAGCWAAIGAAKQGVRVALVEKGATIRSGAGGSGCDHWQFAATNPCSTVTPEELMEALIEDHRGYYNGISHYIECREGWDRLLDMETMGGKIRDTEDRFKGADFRDEKTKLLFAYDYRTNHTLRVWGTTFKPALYKECRRLGVKIFDRVMGVGLLNQNGPGSRVVGATGFNVRTGAFQAFKARAVVMAMARPARIWLFSGGHPGLSDFRPMQCSGDGHAMGWRAGARFSMMEESVRANWFGDRSYPPYGAGNARNTWYACTMVDAEGREIPWVDRDGKVLKTVRERYYPAPGQKFFLNGGGLSGNLPYSIQGPDIMPVDRLLKLGFKFPFYADLSSMPEHERKVLWGMMVGQEGKTKVPILQNYTAVGFDPDKDMLQSYGTGWMSANFLPQERQMFGLPGGLWNDWHLMSNLDGLFGAGDQLFATSCHGHAAATGHYAGRQAAAYARSAEEPVVDPAQVESQKDWVYAPLKRPGGVNWKELNAGIARVMQNYCGEPKIAELLALGLATLQELGESEARVLYARNPHELMRSLEVLNILTCAEIVVRACQARRASSKPLSFIRADYPELDPPEWRKWVTLCLDKGRVQVGELPLDYYGDLTSNYEKHNQEYIKGGK